jgi:RimJ/RimL family protein N-acetyltransferase
VVFEITKFESWQQLRDLRLHALEDSPEWFAARLEVEKIRSGEEWINELATAEWRVIRDGEKSIGMMAVSAAEAIRDADCWLFGCWIAPEYRGQGLMTLIINELDEICKTKNWSKQGLGVWPNNVRAIRSYEKFGFYVAGEPRPSRSRPDQLYVPMYRHLPNAQ